MTAFGVYEFTKEVKETVDTSEYFSVEEWQQMSEEEQRSAVIKLILDCGSSNLEFVLLEEL